MMIIPTNELLLNKSGKLQEQLYRQLTQRIISKQYPAGSRLPSSRLMAAELSISRNTVNAVYEQMKAEGFLYSLPGKGFFVHEDIATDIEGSLTRIVQDSPADKASGQNCFANSNSAWSANLQVNTRVKRSAAETWLKNDITDYSLPFTPGLPDFSAFPVKAWNRILHHQESRKQLMGYGEHQGYLPLRKMIADYLQTSRGVKCSADQVIVTHGAQQALALIAEVCLQPGDKILTEDPGYRGARYALNRFGNDLIPVALKNNSLDVATLPSDPDVRLLYCTPTHQYPMGGILDIADRMALLNWANQHQVWILEDDYDSEFHFYSKPFPAIQGIYDQTPVFYVGSFSKTIMPALRIGYLVVPEAMVDTFIWTKRMTGGESALLPQAVTAEFIEGGQFSRHLRRMRQRYREKWEVFQGLVTSELQGKFKAVAESAGMHLVLEGGSDDVLLYQQLLAQGFGSAPLSSHFLKSNPIQGLILGFASASEVHLEQCIALLKQITLSRKQT